MKNTLSLPDSIAYKHKGLSVFRTYDDVADKTWANDYLYSWCGNDIDGDDNQGFQFDIQKLPTFVESKSHAEVLAEYIEMLISEGEANAPGGVFPWAGAGVQGEYGTVGEISVLTVYSVRDDETVVSTSQAYLPERSDDLSKDREVLERFKMEVEVDTFPETARLYSFTLSSEQGYWDNECLSEKDLRDTFFPKLPDDIRAECEAVLDAPSGDSKDFQESTDGGFVRLSVFYPGYLGDRTIMQTAD